jgi:hypothetical protein
LPSIGYLNQSRETEWAADHVLDQALNPCLPRKLGTQHIPAKGSHLIRGHRPKVGCGWYSNKSRGMRKKAEAEASAEPLSEDATTSRSSQAWAMLIKRIYEIDPLTCPHCGSQMKVVAFIEPPQSEVIEEILKYCGL